MNQSFEEMMAELNAQMDAELTVIKLAVDEITINYKFIQMCENIYLIDFKDGDEYNKATKVVNSQPGKYQARYHDKAKRISIIF